MGLGDGVVVAEGVRVAVGVRVGDGVRVIEGVTVAVRVAVLVKVMEDVTLAVLVDVADAVCVDDGVRVIVGVLVLLGVLVGVKVSVGMGEGPSAPILPSGLRTRVIVTTSCVGTGLVRREADRICASAVRVSRVFGNTPVATPIVMRITHTIKPPIMSRATIPTRFKVMVAPYEEF